MVTPTLGMIYMPASLYGRSDARAWGRPYHPEEILAMFEVHYQAAAYYLSAFPWEVEEVQTRIRRHAKLLERMIGLERDHAIWVSDCLLLLWYCRRRRITEWGIDAEAHAMLSLN